MASPNLLFVCTGNATRSVIAANLVARARPQWLVSSAGTMSIDGLASSPRTLAALRYVGLDDVRHRSAALRDHHLEDIDLVVCFERDHVAYIRRRHPDAAARTGTIRRLDRDLAAGTAPLPERVGALRLGEVDLQPWEELDDPAGGDEGDFIDCADEISILVARLLPRLG